MQKRIIDIAKYIKNNWDGMEAQVKHSEVSCSSEGHLSHTFCTRMSSRPMRGVHPGAEGMAQMREVKANIENVKDHYLTRLKEALVIVGLKQAVKKLDHLRNKKC